MQMEAKGLSQTRMRIQLTLLSLKVGVVLPHFTEEATEAWGG